MITGIVMVSGYDINVDGEELTGIFIETTKAELTNNKLLYKKVKVELLEEIKGLDNGK